MKKNRFYKILRLVQYLLFLPFVFSFGLFIFQTFVDLKVIFDLKEYIPGYIIVSDKYYENYNTDNGGYTVNYYSGYINKIKIIIDEGDIKHFILKKNIHLKDTIFVFYKPNGINTLPRFKNETKIQLSRYLYPYGRLFMLWGIFPFLIIYKLNNFIKKK